MSNIESASQRAIVAKILVAGSAGHIRKNATTLFHSGTYKNNVHAEGCGGQFANSCRTETNLS